MSNPSYEDLLAKVKELSAVKISISKKTGCLCLHVGRQYPVAVYKDEVEKILNSAEAIKDFIAKNIASLPTKAESFSKRVDNPSE